ERVVIPKKPADEAGLAQSAQTVSGLLSSVPKDYGFYRASAADARQSLAVLQQKVLAPHFGAAGTERLAPQVRLTSGEAGTSSDLETRIDVEPASRAAGSSAAEALLQELDKAKPQALLAVQATRKNADGVLLSIPTVVAIAGASDWDMVGLQRAAQDLIAPGMTASRLGLQWSEVKDGGYYEFDGLNPVQMAVRGRVVYFSNDVGLLISVLQTKNQTPAQPPVYAAGFSHARERENFYKLSSLLDQGARATDAEPQFFSQNMASFSRSFAKLESEEVITRQT